MSIDMLPPVPWVVAAILLVLVICFAALVVLLCVGGGQERMEHQADAMPPQFWHTPWGPLDGTDAPAPPPPAPFAPTRGSDLPGRRRPRAGVRNADTTDPTIRRPAP